MTPFYFGAGERRLFGVYAPGRAGGGRARAMLICPPWGHEYLRAHRALRALADRLNEAGVHSLRFDYFGTGDSAGEMDTADLAGWEADIETAIEELRDTAELNSVGLVGLRLGATMAARVAARRRDVHSLVLWDPVPGGAGFLGELEGQHSSLMGSLESCVRPQGRPGVQLVGFAVLPEMRQQLLDIDLWAHMDKWPKRTLAVVSAATQPCAEVRSKLESCGTCTAEFDAIDAPPAWLDHQDSGAGAIPVPVIDRIVAWCK